MGRHRRSPAGFASHRGAINLLSGQGAESCYATCLHSPSWAGLGIAAVRVARGDHPVDATGPAMGLNNMIPAVPAIAQANGALFIYWLLLPIVHWGADIPGGTFVADFIVGVERCGPFRQTPKREKA